MKTRDWYLVCLMEECFEITIEVQAAVALLDACSDLKSSSLSQEVADLVGTFALLADNGILVGGGAQSARVIGEKCADLSGRLPLDGKARTRAALVELVAALSHLGMRVSKALRFGLSEIQPEQPLNNAQRIVDAYDRVLGVAVFLNDVGGLSFERGVLMPASKAKMTKVQKFLGYAREVGAVED